MKEVDYYYYAVEKHHDVEVKLHKICVGVRCSELNPYVRSLLAFSKHEMARYYANRHVPLPCMYYVFSSGHDYSVIHHRLYLGLEVVEHAGPKEFCEHIGYDRKRKRFINSEVPS